MTDREINKWLRKQFSGICWLLIGYNLLMNLMVYATAFMDIAKQILWNVAVGRFPLDIDDALLAENAWGYIFAIAAAWCILYAWKGSSYWKQEIFQKGKSIDAAVIFCVFSLCIGVQFISSLWLQILEGIMNCFGKSILSMLEYVGGRSTSFSMFFYSAVLAPVWEEIIFRGVILRSLRPCGKRFAIFGSAILFALFHGNLLQAPYAFVMGLLFGYLTCEYSISWSIVLHIFNNLVLAEGMTWLMELLPVFLANMVDMILFYGFSAVSIVILVRKHGEIREYRREWMDRRVMKCFLTNSGFLVFLAMMTVSMILFLQ